MSLITSIFTDEFKCQSKVPACQLWWVKSYLTRKRRDVGCFLCSAYSACFVDQWRAHPRWIVCPLTACRILSQKKSARVSHSGAARVGLPVLGMGICLMSSYFIWPRGWSWIENSQINWKILIKRRTAIVVPHFKIPTSLHRNARWSYLVQWRSWDFMWTSPSFHPLEWGLLCLFWRMTGEKLDCALG